MTAAAFSVVIGVSTVLIALDRSPSPGTEWLAALSSLLSLAVIVAVPVLVWLLHSRRPSLMAVIGGVLGAASTGVVFFVVVALSALLGFVVSPFWGAEYAGLLIALLLLAVAGVATVIWLVLLAIRDLDALIFALVAGIAAALAVLGAEIATALARTPPDTRATVGLRKD